MPVPQAPSIPLSDVTPRLGDTPQADVGAAVRDSGTVIAFLSSGGTRAFLTTRVHDVLTTAEGCGLTRVGSLVAFAEHYCDSADGRRRLVQTLAMHRPASDPTALLTRMAITAWVRTVGLAAQTRDLMDTTTSGLPAWHTPGDV